MGQQRTRMGPGPGCSTPGDPTLRGAGGLPALSRTGHGSPPGSLPVPALTWRPARWRVRAKIFLRTLLWEAVGPPLWRGGSAIPSGRRARRETPEAAGRRVGRARLPRPGGEETQPGAGIRGPGPGTACASATRRPAAPREFQLPKPPAVGTALAPPAQLLDSPSDLLPTAASAIQNGSPTSQWLN